MFPHEDFGGQLVWALQRYVQVDIQGPEQSFFEEETQEPPTAPGEGTNQHNEPSQATDPANANALNTIPNNAEELHPLIQEMLDRGGNNLDDDIIGVMAAAPMIDDDNQPAPENLLSTEDSTGATDDIMGLWTIVAFANGKQQSNAMPSQNLPSGCHRCPTLRTSTCSKGGFSPPSSKQQSFPKPTKTFPIARNPSYMGNFYVGLVCGC